MHIYNLKQIADQASTGKMTRISFYHKLIAAFKGAKVFSKTESENLKKLFIEEHEKAMRIISNTKD
jgi:hypothetical protein